LSSSSLSSSSDSSISWPPGGVDIDGRITTNLYLDARINYNKQLYGNIKQALNLDCRIDDAEIE
jgi:hypothetical protein